MFLAGIALFTLASAACALATEPWMLIAARAIQGVGAAAVMPLSLTLLAGAVPDKMRSAAIGIWGGISGLGVAVGPVVGGAVVDGLNWQWIFWLNVPVGVVAVLLAARVLTESKGGEAAGPARAGAVRGRRAGDRLGRRARRRRRLDVGRRAGLAGRRCGAARPRSSAGSGGRAAPMLPLRLFRSAAFSVVNITSFTFSVGVFGSVFLLAQFFQVVQGYSPLESGVRTLPWTMAPMVVAPIAGLIVDRVGARDC